MNTHSDSGGWEDDLRAIIGDVVLGYYESGETYRYAGKYTNEKIGELKTLIRNQIATAKQEGVRETEKAFGGCKKCYGKGYSTVMYGVRGAEDFGGDGFHEKPSVHINFCSCERGKQIDDLLSKLN